MATKNFHISFQLVLGFLVVSLGVLFLLQNFGILYVRDYTRYWPVLLILYGLSRIVQCETTPQRVWGGFWVIVGSLWLVDKLDLFYFDFWSVFWPMVLITLGASLIWRPSRRNVSILGGATVDDSYSSLNAFAFLGGFKRANDSQDFRGGEVTAIMGGCEIDLRRASIKENEAVLQLVAIMGGVELRVPEDWRVVLQGIPILGGFEDKTRPLNPETAKRLVVRGYAVMGGVEIKN